MSDEADRIAPPAVYYYRRRLRPSELWPAVGAAAGAALAAFYIAKILLRRTPLVTPPEAPRARSPRRGAPSR